LLVCELSEGNTYVSESVMKVLLRNPRRELDIPGPRRVHALLNDLDLNRESHLVIRNGTLVPSDEELGADDVVEIRPVISGGSL
jgi:sulfur carrier protein